MVEELEVQDIDDVDDGVTLVADDDGKKLVPITELRKVRKEAETNRKALLEYKAKIKAQEESVRLASLDEKSALEERLKKAESDNKILADKMNRVQMDNAIISLAVGLGFADAKDVIKLLDISDVKDEEGNIDHNLLESAVKKIAEEKPYLRKVTSDASRVTNPDISKNLGTLKPKLTDGNSIDQMKHQSMELIKQGKIAEATRLYNNAWEQTQGLKRN
jgi:hypothetical protein